LFSYQAVLGLFCIFVGIVTLFLPPRRLGARTAPRLPPQIQRIVPYLIALAMIGLGIALIVQGSR
jgi:threonine/homoserine/homoserine lactone efflux protein